MFLILYFKTGKLIMYRQQGHTSHLLHATKSDMSLSSDLPGSTCLEASSKVVSLLKSASLRSFRRSSSFSSIVMDRMSKAWGHLWA